MTCTMKSKADKRKFNSLVAKSRSSLTNGGFKGGKGGANAPPLWRLVMYFCVHICTSQSNDYTAVAFSNNNQAQLDTRTSVPCLSQDVYLGLQLFRDIQFGLSAILNNSLASYDFITYVMNAFT